MIGIGCGSRFCSTELASEMLPADVEARIIAALSLTLWRELEQTIYS
jgi:hypothetical protein